MKTLRNKSNIIFSFTKDELESYLNDNKDNLDKQEKELVTNFLKKLNDNYYGDNEL